MFGVSVGDALGASDAGAGTGGGEVAAAEPEGVAMPFKACFSLRRVAEKGGRRRESSLMGMIADISV